MAGYEDVNDHETLRDDALAIWWAGVDAVRSDVLVRAAVSRARSHCDCVQFSAEDATRSDLPFLARVLVPASG